MARRSRTRTRARSVVSTKKLPTAFYYPIPLYRLAPRTAFVAPSRRRSSSRVSRHTPAVWLRAPRKVVSAKKLPSFFRHRSPVVSPEAKRRASGRQFVSAKKQIGTFPFTTRILREPTRDRMALVRDKRSPKRHACKCHEERSEAQQRVTRAFIAGYGGRRDMRKKIGSCTC